MTAVRQWTGREANALRAALRLSIRGFAEYLGIGVRTVTKWQARGRDVILRPAMQSVLDTALGRSSEDVRARFELLLVPAQPAAEPTNVYLAGSGEREVSPVPTRREVFSHLGAGLTAIGIEQAAGAILSAPRVIHALKVTRQVNASDSAAVENLSVLVEHYKRTFRSSPPAALYDEILGVRVHAGSLLDRTHAATNQPDLAVAAGWLSNLLALATHDLDDRSAALVWCSDAERRSREANCPELAGWAAQTRVLMSFYDGHVGDAVAHARRGQQFAPLGTAAHAKLLAQEMRAWALVGNADKVSSTRRRAEQAIAKLPMSTPTQGTFSISLADDPPYTATSLLLLGQFREAVQATQRVITSFYSPRSLGGLGEHPSGFARTYLILALALAGLGKLDEAHEAAGVALGAPRLVWPVAFLAHKLDRTLMRDFPNTVEARDYHERYVAAVQPNLVDLPSDR